MSVILRVDDFPFTKPGESWRHNLENFKRFDAVLEKHGLEYTLGVIPRWLDVGGECIDWLARNERVEVALHGVEHDERFPNEFRDFETEDDVYRKLLSAKEPLKECNGFGDVIRYIPPHNVVDLKTCKALARAGFTTVMGGPGSDLQLFEKVKKDGLLHTFYSDHPVWYGRSDEMRERDGAVPKILENASRPGMCLTLHWTWEWNIGLSHLDTFLGEIAPVFKPELG